MFNSPRSLVSRCRSVATLPNQGGSYLLLIRVSTPITLPQKRFQAHGIAPGRYIYAGNAYGAGGLKARLGRHLKRRKKKRWHVDHLTTQGLVVEVLAVPNGRECELLALVLSDPKTTVPLPGFGNSDCRRCPAHLVAAPEDFDLTALPVEGFFWARGNPDH